MSLPPLPTGPKNRYGQPIENLGALLTVWSVAINAIVNTLPSLLRRLAQDIDSHR